MKNKLKIAILAFLPLMANAGSINNLKGTYHRVSYKYSGTGYNESDPGPGFCEDNISVESASAAGKCSEGLVVKDLGSGSTLVSYCNINGGPMSADHGTDEHGGHRSVSVESKYDGQTLQNTYIAKDSFLGISKIGEMRVDSLQLGTGGILHYQITSKSASGPFSDDKFQYDCIYQR